MGWRSVEGGGGCCRRGDMVLKLLRDLLPWNWSGRKTEGFGKFEISIPC